MRREGVRGGVERQRLSERQGVSERKRDCEGGSEEKEVERGRKEKGSSREGGSEGNGRWKASREHG